MKELLWLPALIIAMFIGSMAAMNYKENPPTPTLQTLDTTLAQEICERKGGVYTSYLNISSTPMEAIINDGFCGKNGLWYFWQNGEWTSETKNVLEAGEAIKSYNATGILETSGLTKAEQEYLDLITSPTFHVKITQIKPIPEVCKGLFEVSAEK